MVITEAMACGLPVVSFDCPWGPRSIITDGEDGILVENGNFNALALCLSRLIFDEKKRFSIANTCIHSVRRYDLDNTCITVFGAVNLFA